MFPILPVLIVAAVAGVILAILLFKGEQALVADRQKCSKLGKLLGQYGHVIASDVLQDLATGDLIDAIAVVEQTFEKLVDPSTGPTLLQNDLVSQLNAQLAMPGAAPTVLTAIANFAANPANAAIVKAAGLAIVAAA